MSTGKKLAIIATKGSLDGAYPPFILASTAAALGYDVQIYFTFYGLQCLKRKLDLQVTSLGNPGMPMPVPMPVLMQALPGMQAMMTTMMKRTMKAKGIADLTELRSLCLEAGVAMIACQMAMDLFEFDPKELIDGIEFGGAATFFEFAGESDMCLYI